MSGELEIDLMIGRLRKLPDLARAVAPECARVVEAEIKRTTSAGTDPYGTPWQKTRKGNKPLANAFAAVAVAAIGPTVYVVVRGINARHHFGSVRGKVKREIIPRRGIPPAMAAAMQDVIGKAFLKAMVE